MMINEKSYAELTSFGISRLAELKTITERAGIALQTKGKFDQGDIEILEKISATLKDLRLLNILVGKLGGLSNKKLAEIHGVTPSRISQIIMYPLDSYGSFNCVVRLISNQFEVFEFVIEDGIRFTFDNQFR